MDERKGNPMEMGREFVPTTEQVRALFDRLVGERKYENARKKEDEKGCTYGK